MIRSSVNRARFVRPSSRRAGLSLRLDEKRGSRQAAQDRLAVHLRHGRLQPGSTAQAAGGCGVTPEVCPKRLPRSKSPLQDAHSTEPDIALSVSDQPKPEPFSAAC